MTRTLAAILFSIVIVHHSAFGKYLREDEILASYRMERNGSESTVRIVMRENGLLNIHLYGGGDGALGDQLPATCEMDAQGGFHINILNAVIMDDEEAEGKRTEENHLKLAMKFKDRNQLELLRADTLTICGLGASFVGKYKRFAEIPSTPDIILALEKGKAELRGKLGKKAIEMEIERRGWSLVGHYRYGKSKGKLELSGSELGREVTLTEFKKKSKTGEFVGVVKGDTFEGTWKSPDGKRELPFELSLKRKKK